MQNQFAMFAAYNRWANERLYGAAAKLSQEQYRRDTGAFFHSMSGTLNHLLVADRIWMKRFTGLGQHPDRLDAVLHEDLAPLREARIAEDQRIIDWIDGLREEDLASTISFRTITQPMEITQKLAPALSHLFNHQTHHRGHAHMILSVLGAQPPSLDLIMFLRGEEGRQYM